MSTIAGWEILVETAVQREIIAALCGQWGIVRERPRISMCKREPRQSLDGQVVYYPGGRRAGVSEFYRRNMEERR